MIRAMMLALLAVAALAAPAPAQDALPDPEARYYSDLADSFEAGWNELKARRAEIRTGLTEELKGLATDLDAALEANVRIGTYADWHNDWLSHYRKSAEGFGWMLDILLAATGGGAAVVAARALSGAIGGATNASRVIASGLKRSAA